ncbi:MAG: hypothetical protein LBF82_01780 [Lactobacillales bacterium]|nr:hypothetical protein [Lactobacillales bacterium]
MKKIVGLILILIFAMNSQFFVNADVTEDAERLYTLINEFLRINQECSSENFEDVCRQYLLANSPRPRILGREEFVQNSRNKIILYRGTKKKYADEFKLGQVYIAKNTRNVRGCGIYTTGNLACAELFANTPDGIITMFIDDKSKLLRSDYLEEIKNIMIAQHKSEFAECVASNRSNSIYDSASEYISEYMSMWAIKNGGCDTFEKLQQVGESLSKDSKFIELNRHRKIYFKDKRTALFYDSGMLTKLLGYDVLGTEEYDDELGVDIQEYLVVNPFILTISI